MATKDKLINLEDLKVLSDHVEGEVTDLKSDLSDIWDVTRFNKTATGGGTVFPYTIVAGKTYIITNETDVSGVGIRTCTSDGTQVENIKNGIAANESLTFTAAQNASYIRIYSTSAVVVSIKSYGTTLADTFEDIREQLDNGLSNVNNQMEIIQTYNWKNGYVATNGTIVSHNTRKYSELIVCPANTPITYVAEKHANVYGISFWDANKTFISGIAYTGDDAENTVTSPANTMYARLSTTSELLSESYIAFSGTGMIALGDAINTIDRRFLRYIPFTTNGTNRSEQYTDLQGMIIAEVIDDAYEIGLYYNDGQLNTGWQKRINVQSYNNPTYLRLRKVDDSVMPAGSATTVATAIRTTGLVTFGDLSGEFSGYVDGEDGSDSNSGDSWATAFATIQKAIDAGYKSIRIKPGTYAAGISMSAMQGVHIYCDKSFDSFDATNAPNNSKVIIDCNNSLINGVLMQSCIDCSFTDIEVKNATGNGFDIRKCSGDMLFDGCISHDNPTGQGFYILNTNASFVSCGAYNIGTMGGGEHHDGFNIHGTGTTSFKDCWGHDCEDDGISHHDACYGYIDGGEWYNCGKGGVASPTHGAKIDVTNVYSHDNNYGLYAENSTDATLAKTSNISNCVFKDNNVYDIATMNNTLNIWNCVYDTINHSGAGSNNVIN
jgi:hypothetical protein